MKYANLRTALLALKGQRSEIETAAVIGVAPNTLGNWTDGTHLPPSTRLPSLATALDMHLDDLIEMVARERLARSGGKSRCKDVVGRRVHGHISCPKVTAKPARNRGQSASKLSGAKGGAK